jgi:hypothetical protein
MRRTAAVLTTISGIAIVVAGFLPWIRSVGGMPTMARDSALIPDFEGGWTVIFAGIAIFATGLGYVAGLFRARTWVLFAAVALAWTIWTATAFLDPAAWIDPHESLVGRAVFTVSVVLSVIGVLLIVAFPSPER